LEIHEKFDTLRYDKLTSENQTLDLMLYHFAKY